MRMSRREREAGRSGGGEERYLTIQDAADLLGVSRATIWRRVREGKLHTSGVDPLDRRASLIARGELTRLMARSPSYARRAARVALAS